MYLNYYANYFSPTHISFRSVYSLTFIRMGAIYNKTDACIFYSDSQSGVCQYKLSFFTIRHVFLIYNVTYYNMAAIERYI